MPKELKPGENRAGDLAVVADDCLLLIRRGGDGGGWAEDATCVHIEAIVASRARTCIEPVDPRSNPSDPRCVRHLDERTDR